MESFANSRPLMAALISVGVLGFTSSASAIVTQQSDVLIRGNGFDLGGFEFVGDAPTGPATIEWNQGWFGVVPTLTGTLHLSAVADSCSRVRVISYDEDDLQIREARFSEEECVFGDGHAARQVEVQAEAGASRVEVTLQTLAVNGDWGAVGNRVSVEYGPQLDVDLIAISGDEFQLGSGAFVAGSPEGDATVTWTVGEGNQLTPVMSGSVYARRADDRCFRIRVAYWSQLDVLIEERLTVEQCLTDDALHIFPMLLNAFASAAVSEARYTLESRPNGGVWEAVGATTTAVLGE